LKQTKKNPSAKVHAKDPPATPPITNILCLVTRDGFWYSSAAHPSQLLNFFRKKRYKYYVAATRDMKFNINRNLT
jgi:hypothetical protein